ncbi:MAG: hypothetical protein RSE12_17000 [Fuscovulum sp.]|nr:MAG: hypothetical protein RSE12_17000 [Fuscovulum sp.]
MKSAVLIAPGSARAAANALAAKMGWGTENYSVPLSPTGATPATHWGCRADVSDSFVALLENPPAEAVAVIAVLTIDLREGGDPRGHFLEVIASLGLQFVQSED